MAQVALDVGGRRYELAVREGQEAHFETLAAMVDAKVRLVGAAGINEARQLLMAALLLADDLRNAGFARPPAASPHPDVAPRIEALAVRLEKLAMVLEKSRAEP